MAVIGLQSSIWSNRLKSTVLVLLFPILVFLVIFGLIYFLQLQDVANVGMSVEQKTELSNYKTYNNLKLSLSAVNIKIAEHDSGTSNSIFTDEQYSALLEQKQSLENQINEIGKIPFSLDVIRRYESQFSSRFSRSMDATMKIFSLLGPVILMWALISFLFHRQIIFAFTGAKPLQRKDEPEIYNIVENLCISRGLPTPKIGILEDDSLNAFAVGWNPKKSWIVFSRGIVNVLNKEELEAVAAHELTHIMNKDGLLMVTIIVFIGAIAAIGEILFRIGRSMGSSDSKSKGNQLQLAFFVLGIALLLLGYIILPLVQLAVSRKREYLADAGSVALTHDKQSMISALLKISKDSTIESIKKDSVSALCIANPFPKSKGLINSFHEFFSTHPTIENRISILAKY